MPDYSLADLSALTGLPVRTIRFYIAEGLIPSPGREGPTTRYPEATLSKLRLIARLRDAHESLSEIRAGLAGLTEAQLAELATGSEPPAVARESALDYIRGILGDPRAELGEEESIFGTGIQAPARHAASAPRQGSPASPAARAAAGAEPLEQATDTAGTVFAMVLPPGEAELTDALAHPSAAHSFPPAPASPAPRASTAAEPSAPRSNFERSQWERIALVEGIELHIQRPLSRRGNRMVERLIAFTRQLSGEDPL